MLGERISQLLGAGDGGLGGLFMLGVEKYYWLFPSHAASVERLMEVQRGPM
jgi:hypothetical protein